MCCCTDNGTCKLPDATHALVLQSMVTDSLADAVVSEEAAQIFGAYEREYERAWHAANAHAKTRTVMKMLPSGAQLPCTPGRPVP